MPNRIYDQSHKDACLKTQWDYYENNKEAIKEQAKSKYHNLTREEKDKRCEYAKNWYNNLSEHKKKNEKRAYGNKRYHNMLEEKKQKLKEYQKIYREKKKQELQSIKKE